MQNLGLNNHHITMQCLNFHTAEFCECETTTDSSGAQQDIHLSTLSLGSDVAVSWRDPFQILQLFWGFEGRFAELKWNSKNSESCQYQIPTPRRVASFVACVTCGYLFSAEYICLASASANKSSAYFWLLGFGRFCRISLRSFFFFSSNT